MLLEGAYCEGEHFVALQGSHFNFSESARGRVGSTAITY